MKTLNLNPPIYKYPFDGIVELRLQTITSIFWQKIHFILDSAHCYLQQENSPQSTLWKATLKAKIPLTSESYAWINQYAKASLKVQFKDRKGVIWRMGDSNMPLKVKTEEGKDALTIQLCAYFFDSPEQ